MRVYETPNHQERAKTKRSVRLERVRNLLANPKSGLLTDAELAVRLANRKPHFKKEKTT